MIRLYGSAVVVVTAASLAQAQVSPTLAIKSAVVGSCQVVLSLSGTQALDMIGVEVDGTVYQEQQAGTQTELTFPVHSVLRSGSRIVVNLDGVGVLRDSVRGRTLGGAPPTCTMEQPSGGRVSSSFEVSAYLGMVVDNFAPSKIANYVDGIDNTRKSQYIFGFDFDYRLLGKPSDRVQLWINGETMHGVRTADVDCTDANPTKRPPLCSDSASIQDKARYIVGHATSLEAYLAPRLEFHEFQSDSDSPASAYVSWRTGFIALYNTGKVFATNEAAVGLIVNDGDYYGSYLEAGLGRNQLLGSKNRLMIDGLLSFGMDGIPLVGKYLSRDFRVFVEATVDNDLGEGSDAVRSYYGFDFNPRSVFGKK